MEIRVRSIPSGGLQLTVDRAQAWTLESAAEAMDAEPHTLEGGVDVSAPTKDGRVDVRCQVHASACRSCDRCGEQVEVAVDVDALLLYFPRETASASTGEIDLNREDLEVGWYESGVIRADDVLREALTLALPTRVLCQDDLVCNRRLESLLRSVNTSEVGHPAFAVLREVH